MLNVGAVAAPDVAVSFESIGVAGGQTVTDVYAKQTKEVAGGAAGAAGFNVTVPGMGGTLMIVAPVGTVPADCVA